MPAEGCESFIRESIAAPGIFTVAADKAGTDKERLFHNASLNISRKYSV